MEGAGVCRPWRGQRGDGRLTDTSAAGTFGTVDRDQWSRVLDQLTERHAGEPIRIEVLDQTYGDQNEVERLPFTYAAYDPKDDVVILAVGGSSPRYPVVLRHMVWHPTEVSITDDESTGTSLRLVEQDASATLVNFYREPA
jgi:Family of unknown function (DUF5335)